MTRYHATVDGDVPFTAEEEAEWDARESEWNSGANDRAEANVREKRNALLVESDWTQIADATVDKAAWATYRQSLRDITTHSNFPDLEDSDWPTAP